MLIFFDIDGTLIGEQSHVMLESTKEAVQRARSLGHICMINTGRSGKLVGADVTGLTHHDCLPRRDAVSQDLFGGGVPQDCGRTAQARDRRVSGGQ